MTGKATYVLPEIVDLNSGDTYEVELIGHDESFMTYDAESNSIIIDKSKAKYGKHEIEIKIVDSRFAQYSSTFEINI